jgi:hypothetical protein
MGRFLIAGVAFVAGLLVGGTAAMTLGGGGLVGLGIGTGLSAGICSTVRAAQEEGLLTAEQVDQALNRAASDLRPAAGADPGAEIVGSAAACGEGMARLAAAGQQ